MYYLCDLFQKIAGDKIHFIPSLEIEQELEKIVKLCIGYTSNGVYNEEKLNLCFSSIIKSIPTSSAVDITSLLKEYQANYLKIFDDNYLTELFVSVVKKIYSPNYDGKLGNYNLSFNQEKETASYVEVLKNKISISHVYDKEDEMPHLPDIVISDAYEFNDVLRNFLAAVQETPTAYNIFIKPGFTESYDESDLMKMLFEGVLLNANLKELGSIDLLFSKYTSFMNDEVMPRMTQTGLMGNAFEDEAYLKVKRSDMEYETPWYLSFMLKNHGLELPNIRCGIIDNNGEKTANIITIQSSQLTGPNPEVSQTIKQMIPKSSKYRFFNPDHFASLVLAFGLFNGLGITNINIQGFMPIRYYKTTKDRFMNEQEASKYRQRVYEQNRNCFYKMNLLTGDITIVPDEDDNIIIQTSETIDFHNDFLNNLYSLGYNYGKSHNIGSRDL